MDFRNSRSRPGAVREAPIVLALTALLTASSVVPPGVTAAAAGLGALVLTAIAWKRRAPASSSLGLLFVLVRTFIPDWGLWRLVPAAIVFSTSNAALEEAAYRGVVLDALDRALGAGVAALVLQAIAFAALHFNAGFPRGLVGVGLTFVYGLVLGALRRRAGGLMAPFITHVLTDLVIVTIVLAVGRT